MILYSEDQLHDAWQYDCKKRSAKDNPWLKINQYEEKFINYLDLIIAGEEKVELDIHIPKYILESIGIEIDFWGEELH
jgi:hypothetical protein